MCFQQFKLQGHLKKHLRKCFSGIDVQSHINT
jgi:hypothetical protein